MRKTFTFIKFGFENFWKEKSIWFFSALPFFFEIFYIIINLNLRSPFISRLYDFLDGILISICNTGIIFAAFLCVSKKSVTLQTIITGIKSYYWKGVGCKLILFLIFSPILIVLVLLFWIAIYQHNEDLPLILIFTFVPLTVFFTISYLSMFELFNQNLGIWKSIKNGFRFFGSHIVLFVSLGIITGTIYLAFQSIITIIISILFTNSKIGGVFNFYYLFQNSSINSNPFYIIFSGLGMMLWYQFSSFVFASAYNKYSSVSDPSSESCNIPLKNE